MPSGSAFLASALLCVAAVVLAAVARCRLSAGVRAGLPATALAALVLLFMSQRAATTSPPLALAMTLVLLTIFCLAAAVSLQPPRSAPAAENRPADSARQIWAGLLSHFGALAALVAAALVWLLARTIGTITSTLLLLLAFLLMWAAIWHVVSRTALSRCAAGGAFLAALLLPVPLDRVMPWYPAAAAGAVLGGLAAMLAVVVAILRDWRVRVRIWHYSPDRLVEPPPPHPWLYTGVIVLCTAIGGLGLVTPTAPLVWLGVLLAALAVLSIAHRRQSVRLGGFGLILLAEGIVTAAPAFLPRSPGAPLLGWALAGAYLLWLARFWQQQLNHGRPWTTAGRLIPVARTLSYASVGGQVLVAALWAFQANQTATPATGSAVVAAVFVWLHASLLVRDAAAQRNTIPAWAAGALAAAGLVPIYQLLATLHYAVPASLLLAAAALLLALRASPRDRAYPAWLFDAYIAAILPLAALLAAIGFQPPASLPTTGTLTVLILAAAVLVRWWPRPTRRAAAGPESV